MEPATVSYSGGPATRRLGDEVRTLRLLVVTPRAHLGAVPELFAELAARGARLLCAGVGRGNVERALERLELAGASAVALPLRRKGPDADAVRAFRALCDLALFLKPDFAAVPWARLRSASGALAAAGAKGRFSAEAFRDLVLPADPHAALSAILASIERGLPPEQRLVDAIGALDVDAVLLVSRCSRKGPEPDVIKVARQLGLPSIMLVFSWDNLATRAVLHEHPDHVLVWNDVQAAQATALHGIPAERVAVVGAANFDRFFAELEALDASGLGRGADGGATVAYLGSAKASADEPAIFADWLAAIRAADEPRLRTARVVVRPHPAETAKWTAWIPPPDDLLSIEPASKHDRGSLAALLRRSDAVVALNTTAEIEAAIADCPVVTFRPGTAAAPGQEGMAHFRLLLEEHGGFVLDARDLPEHVAKLGRVVGGGYDAARMRDFVARFVRPGGIGEPVAPRVAEKVLELASRRNLQRARSQ